MKYKNVLCIYPYKTELKTVGFLPPIGLEYIATAIQGLVESIRVVDLRHETEPLDSFLEDGVDLVLFSCNWDSEEEFVRAVINGIPETPDVVVGGRYATEYVDELFEAVPRIDGIVRGGRRGCGSGNRPARPFTGYRRVVLQGGGRHSA